MIINAALVCGLVAFVLQARSTSTTGPTNLNAATNNLALNNPLDQVSSADIAYTVSSLSGMTEQTAIRNQSETEDVQLSAAPVTDNVTSKPQVISTVFKSNKDIQNYVAQAGDTIPSIAAKFGVTSDSIRWSNNLSGDAVAAGTKLLIPPVGYSGIVYTVKPGDTLQSLAQKYKADLSELTRANDAEISGIHAGELIIIPNGQQPSAVRASSYSPSGATTFPWGGTAIYGYNGYDYGYCTWWVANRRAQVGKPLPSNLGNASSWGYLARLAGLPTGSVPRLYAAAVTSTAGEGHVVFVEGVNPDGSIVISEMNHLGWAVKDTMTIPAATAAHYIYIY